MSRIRDIANILSASTDMATDAEVTSSIASHAAAADPHTVYLKESEFWVAGKNKLINGDFNIWQRGTSFSFADNIFAADRFKFVTNGGTDGTGTISRQSFTPGDITGINSEGQYYLRYNLTATGTSTQHYMQQNIEDVRTFAGQTVTWSFWAKADSARTLNLQFIQRFGTGGSTGIVCSTATVTLSTSWTRYSATGTFSSILGKTIGTGSSAEVRLYWNTAAGTTIDFWGWQLEAGSQLTPFITATGNPASELAACQRYYYRITSGSAYGYLTGSSSSGGTNGVGCPLYLPIPMRTTPTVLDYSNIRIDDTYASSNAVTTATIQSNQSTNQIAIINATWTSGIVTGRWYILSANNNAAAYIGVGAEL